jgi:hypothetical protein
MEELCTQGILQNCLELAHLLLAPNELLPVNAVIANLWPASWSQLVSSVVGHWIDTNQPEKWLQLKETFLNGLILALRYLQRKPLSPQPLVNPQGLFYPTGEGSG